MSRISPETSTLKPCPVCHSDQVHLFELQEGLYQVSCENDDDHFCVQVLGGSPKEATERWNDRSGHAQDPKGWRCPHDMGFDREIGPLGCRLIGQEMECVCEARAALADTSTEGNSK